MKPVNPKLTVSPNGMQFPTNSDCELAGTTLTNACASVTTMSPTLVVPPGTGATLPDLPATAVPLMSAVTLTTMLPATVGTPAIEKLPSVCVRAVFDSVAAVAPETGAALASTTLPATVVSGSG